MNIFIGVGVEVVLWGEILWMGFEKVGVIEFIVELEKVLEVG